MKCYTYDVSAGVSFEGISVGGPQSRKVILGGGKEFSTAISIGYKDFDNIVDTNSGLLLHGEVSFTKNGFPFIIGQEYRKNGNLYLIKVPAVDASKVTIKCRSLRVVAVDFYNNKLEGGIKIDILVSFFQNSILKILEEPNESLNIVLTTNKHELLLPTVISRCELILFSGPFEQLSEAGNGDFSAEAQSNHIDRLLSDLIEIQRIFLEIKKQNKKEQFRTIDEFLISRILDQRQSMLHGNSQEKALQNIQLVHETKKMLESKVNTRLALENLVINFTR